MRNYAALVLVGVLVSCSEAAPGLIEDQGRSGSEHGAVAVLRDRLVEELPGAEMPHGPFLDVIGTSESVRGVAFYSLNNDEYFSGDSLYMEYANDRAGADLVVGAAIGGVREPEAEQPVAVGHWWTIVTVFGSSSSAGDQLRTLVGDSASDARGGEDSDSICHATQVAVDETNGSAVTGWAWSGPVVVELFVNSLEYDLGDSAGGRLEQLACQMAEQAAATASEVGL